MRPGQLVCDLDDALLIHKNIAWINIADLLSCLMIGIPDISEGQKQVPYLIFLELSPVLQDLSVVYFIAEQVGVIVESNLIQIIDTFAWPPDPHIPFSLKDDRTGYNTFLLPAPGSFEDKAFHFS